MLAPLFSGKIILLTLQANKLTLSHPQQDMHKLLTFLYKQKYNFKSWSRCYNL